MNDLITSIGLMSGTSCDGIDASVLKSDGESKVHFLGNQFLPYDKKIKHKIMSLKEKINFISDLEKNELEVKDLEREITLLHAKVINLIVKKY